MTVDSGGTEGPADDALNPAGPRRAADRIWFAHALRGLAALLVVWEHLFVGWWQKPRPLGAVPALSATLESGPPYDA